ncbi:MAG: tail fiber protein [Saprospiraceae bacterium]|nr:tail fiber protein [Saprospiraceae bacterium]MDZ4706193.1 tail fiber protein [Saprospiraceae bacterium]
MAEPFLAEIRIFSFGFAPKGWALCNGQLLPINQNQALFSLLGTNYGGNGQTNFALPNLQERAPNHVGDGLTLGERAGQANVTLALPQLPTHPHLASATTATQNAISPANASFADSTPSEFYSGTPTVAMNAGVIASVGGSQPHNNVQPSLVLNMSIALQGIFPSQN